MTERQRAINRLEADIREFFGVPQDTPLGLVKSDWEFGDGRNAGPFVRTLIRAARIAKANYSEKDGGG